MQETSIRSLRNHYALEERNLGSLSYHRTCSFHSLLIRFG